eukprot:jgi/Mesen1/1305/ME000013S00798
MMRFGKLLRNVDRRSVAKLIGNPGAVYPSATTAESAATSDLARGASTQIRGLFSSTFTGEAFNDTGKRSQQAVAQEPTIYNVGESTNIKWHEAKVSKAERQKLMGQKGCVLWMTGLSGSGKSTLAYTLDHALSNLGKVSYVLDGDNVRHGLNKNLGFSAADREENIRRVGEVAKLFADSGIITLVSFISPYRRDREAARALLPTGEFIEIYMKIPLSVCEQRDPKGLYKLARAGKIKGFTGIDDPYEEPDKAELVVEVAKEDGILEAPEKMAETLIKFLESKGFLTGSQ